MRENGVVFIEEEKKLKTARLSRFETELLEATKRRRELEAQLFTIKRELERQQRRVILSKIIAQNPVVSELQSSLLNMEIKLASLLQEKREEHPDVMNLKAAIQENREKLNSIVQNITQSQTETVNPIFQGLLEREIALKAEIGANRARQTALAEIIRGLRVDLKTLPGKEFEFARLQRVLELNRGVYNSMKGRIEKLAIEQESMINEYNIRVLDRAYVSKSADNDSPNWLLHIVVGLFLSCAFGFGAVLMREYLSDAVTSPKDVERILDMPLLGTVPRS
jgi:uncharacterized protein involved in exopolysaccharide biosynthesis